MSENINKLPKWAQHKFRAMEDKINSMREDIAALLEGKETKIEIDPVNMMLNEKRKFVPDHSTIRFTLDNGRIDCRLNYGRLEILGIELGQGNLNVRPHSSNVLTIGFEE